MREFDDLEYNWLSGHRGVDLDWDPGSSVYAAADGTVVYAGIVVDRPVVSISHGKIRSTYEPISPSVSVGEVVAQGQVIGTLLPGHSPGGLHWGAKINASTYVNPLRMMVGPIVLKPWDR